MSPTKKQPVAMLSAGARWYLIGIAAFSLLGIALHLSIQKEAQERAEVLVQTWAKQAYVHIGNVHYHLLRNALILQDIRIKRGADKLTIEHILIRANPERLTSPEPHIREVELSGFKAEYHPASERKAWQQDQALIKIWQATTSLKAKQGQLKLYPHEQSSNPLIANNISIGQQVQSDKRTITVSAIVHDGVLQGSLSTQGNASNGQINWQHINTLQLTRALALQPITGHLNGNLEWQETQTQTEQPAIDMQGELRFKPAESEKTDTAHRLQFTASRSKHDWGMNIHAHAWPLTPWSDALPIIGQRHISTALWQGSSHWQGQPGKWRINASQGVLNDVVLSSSQEASVDWSWQQIAFDGLNIDMPRQRLGLSRIALHDGSLTVNTTANTALSIQSASTWDISVDDIQVRDMTFNIGLSEGNLSLTALEGNATWPRRQDLNFRLKTASPKESTKAQWRLRGSIARHVADPFSKADFSMRVTALSFDSLRLLLPIQGDSNSPVTLAGHVDLHSKISVQQGIWQMRGKATAHDVQISHAGDTWVFKNISSRFGPVGMALDVQNIDQLKADNWRYTAALEPLQPIPSNHLTTDQPTVDQATVSKQPAAWWRSVLRDNNVQIHHISLDSGSISMGQQDSLWAEDVNIQIDGLLAQQAANIKAQAKVSGGSFTIDGDWHALSEPQRFLGTASLQDATPFFLHDWMTASAMPRLIRGRLNARVKIADGQDKDNYQSQWQLQLRRAMTETDIADVKLADDPMLALSGLNTTDLLRYLAQTDDTIKLQEKIGGSWQMQALTFNMMGQSLQDVLHQAAENHEKMPASEVSTTPAKPELAAHIRLRSKGLLSLNERSRLIKVVRLLHNNPKMSIDLKPQWTGQEITPNMLKRIQRTQQLIERYMVHRHIGKQRIFPRWPTKEDQVEEISSIQIVLND